ncbi:MAG: hypothetical protein HKN75_05585 [Bacteroidia bacterium]|nr:hypothetical protein [Bacteroidia bacterium]
MLIFEHFWKGIQSFGTGMQYITGKRFWYYLILPGIINLIIFFGTFSLVYSYSDEFSNWLLQLIGLADADTGFMGGLKKFMYFLLLFLIRVMYFLLYITIYKYVMLIIMAPLLAYISEKVEEVQSGKTYDFNTKQFLIDTWRGIRIAIRNFAFEMLFVVLFLFMGLIPVIGIAAPLLLFVVQSYFYGYSMFDYNNERKRMTVKEGSKFIWEHKGSAIANGAVFHLMYLIPIVGWVVSPVLSVISAGINYHQIEEEENYELIAPHK